MHKHAKQICANGKLNNVSFKANRRFLFYDQLLLIILTLWPLKGKPIFERLFKVRSSDFVLKFLDEKSSLRRFIHVHSTSNWFIFKGNRSMAFLEGEMGFTYFVMWLYAINGYDHYSVNQVFFSSFDVYVLVSGLLIVGIPHGALDH